jgi:3-phosphoshikimate 1-carboxyvinyltransferase
MGGNITISNQRLINEEIIGDIEVQSSHLKGCELNEDMAKLMIDEYPILSVAASFANTPSLFKGLKELRVKESDRLELIRFNLNQCGITCEVSNDNLFIDPRKKNTINNNKIRTDFDHRIAMAFAIMGSKLNHNLLISNPDCIDTSFPNFIKSFNEIGGNLTEIEIE